MKINVSLCLAVSWKMPNLAARMVIWWVWHQIYDQLWVSLCNYFGHVVHTHTDGTTFTLCSCRKCYFLLGNFVGCSNISVPIKCIIFTSGGCNANVKHYIAVITTLCIVWSFCVQTNSSIAACLRTTKCFTTVTAMRMWCQRSSSCRRNVNILSYIITSFKELSLWVCRILACCTV